MVLTDKYLVRLLAGDGVVRYYTGRTGQAWVSGDRGEAFGFLSFAGARNRAGGFNRLTDLHGFVAVAVPADAPEPAGLSAPDPVEYGQWLDAHRQSAEVECGPEPAGNYQYPF